MVVGVEAGGVFEAGKVVAGYTIRAYVGGGSSADVYRVDRHGRPGSLALKILHTDETTHARARERFGREFTIASMLHHPNIVAVYEQGEVAVPRARRPTELMSFSHPPSPSRLWMTMQYVDGPESTVLIPGSSEEPDVAAILRVSRQIASALDYAHSMDVLHRDVKPANILLTADHQTAFLTDFGIAQLIDDVKPLARNGRVRGSIPYVSPELLQAQQLSPATDLYSLACTMFEWLTGYPPYPHRTMFHISNAHLREPIPALTSRRRWLPSALNAVFAKSLAKTPASRYDSCAEFVDIVVRALRDIPSPNAGSGRRRWRWTHS